GGEVPKDFEAVGVSVRERGARTDEAMRALRELFSCRPASFSGRFFSFDEVSIQPAAAQPGGPPLWVGGRSDAAIRRAAQLGDGSQAQCAERVAEYVEAGAEHIVFHPAVDTAALQEQIELLAEVAYAAAR